ncbi:NADP-dependent oxidoreductase [Ktedonobacter robiniae]|uniref:NADPH:quinone reductase n=1 Tax=Ktedonobacter robiniae TaxID=2778365 RepID=A0ABQ3UVG7_9CHLR|nr:NADP-dependent oxidoreductase [Ktedonobacter robiniae]GHO56671.1 NADPH:quinone reductase [Ktedonobacter robiniae]
MEIDIPKTMKAIRFHTYGDPEVLQFEDIPLPSAQAGEVLVRVHAAGVNPGDWQMRSGLAHRKFQIDVPLPYIPGYDVSGIVEAVGPGVTTFQRGDAVYGMTTHGAAYAEYTTADPSHLAFKPVSIDHIQAAGVPMSTFTAWHTLFVRTRVVAGQTVLVNGAAGGVGHFAVQLAKAQGARVIGVASGRNEAFLRELGVDLFIDYTTTPVEQVAHDVDLVIDTVGGENGNRLLSVLKRGGTLIPTTWGHYSTKHAASASLTVEDVVLLLPTTAQLAEISKLIDTGRVRVEVSMVQPLAEAYKAHELSESGHARGKIVLRVVEERSPHYVVRTSL